MADRLAARLSFRRVVARVPWALVADLVAAGALIVAFVMASHGGFTFKWWGVRVASHDLWRPLALAALVILVRFALTRRRSWLLHFAVFGLVVQMLVAHYLQGAGVTSLIGLGGQFEATALDAVRDVIPLSEEHAGYDGQFYVQLAVDPLLRDPAIRTALDDPGYRARRILFPWAAWLLGLGRPFWIVQAYALLNVASWVLLAWVLTRWLPVETGRGFALWFGCLFAPGMAASLTRALPDGPSLLLSALVVLAVERGRSWTATGVLGLAGLGRETALLTGVALLEPGWWRRDRFVRLVGQLALALVPLAVWLAYVKWSVGLSMSAGGSNFAAPLVGYVQKWRTTLHGLLTDGVASDEWRHLGPLIGLAVQAGYLATHRSWSSAWWRVGAVHAVLMAFLGWAVWDGYPGAYTRAALPMTMAFNVCLVRERRFWPWAIAGDLGVLSGLQLLQVPWIHPYL